MNLNKSTRLVKNKILEVFWCRAPKPGNFGDILTPVILDHYGYAYKYSQPEEANTIMVGSIAKFSKPGMLVLGSGIMTEYARVCPDSNWVWARGPRTRKRVIEVGGTCPEIYGDPALLLPRIYNPTMIEKKYEVGIIPHYVDYDQVKKEFSDANVIKLID